MHICIFIKDIHTVVDLGKTLTILLSTVSNWCIALNRSFHHPTRILIHILTPQTRKSISFISDCWEQWPKALSFRHSVVFHNSIYRLQAPQSISWNVCEYGCLEDLLMTSANDHMKNRYLKTVSSATFSVYALAFGKVSSQS